MPLVLEGLVTTLAPGGGLHLAPMGPHVEPGMDRFLLRPFPTAQTGRNLLAHGEGVLHVTDDVLLLARVAVGPVEPPPEHRPAERVRGWVLTGTCRFYEFRVSAVDDSGPRLGLTAEVVHRGTLREFFGFNRAKHAVLEAAILATRLHLLPAEEVAAEYRKLAVIVAKTGGPSEQEAMEFLQAHVERWRAGEGEKGTPRSPGGAP
jgi:uncharacterized protein